MKRGKFVLAIVSISFGPVLLFNACKKDRVPQDDYQNMDSFYDDNKEDEQVYQIDSGGSCPLTCLHGTKICMGASMFSFADGTPITYPFILKVVELYSIKDMLLWKLPSVSGGNVLET